MVLPSLLLAITCVPFRYCTSSGSPSRGCAFTAGFLFQQNCVSHLNVRCFYVLLLVSMYVPSFASSSPGLTETIPQSPFVEEWLQVATLCGSCGQETSIQPGLASWSRVALLNKREEICVLLVRRSALLLGTFLGTLMNCSPSTLAWGFWGVLH